MPSLLSLAAGEIAGEGSTSKGNVHGGGFVAWGGVSPAERKRKKACQL